MVGRVCPKVCHLWVAGVVAVFLGAKGSCLGGREWQRPNGAVLRMERPPTGGRSKRGSRGAQSEGWYHWRGAPVFTLRSGWFCTAGRRCIAVGVEVSASDHRSSLFPVLVAVTCTVYYVPLVRFGML